MQLVLFQEYQDETMLLSVSLNQTSKESATGVGAALVEEYSHFSMLSRKQCHVQLDFDIEADGIELRLFGTDQNEEACVPRNSSLVVSGGLMTGRDRQKVISQIYKFETISTVVFIVTLISCHFELNRLQTSLMEC
jgi:hypothetical protein